MYFNRSINLQYIFIMKRIAIPVVNEKLSEYFEQCHHFKIFELGKTRVISRLLAAPQDIEIFSMPLWLSDQGITDVVTFKIDGRILNLFTNYKINLYIGIKYKLPDEIIKNYLKGNLKSDENIIWEINKCESIKTPTS